MDFASVFHMLCIQQKKNGKKRKKTILPNLSYFSEYVTSSTIPRRIFILLNQYGHTKNESKFLKISPIQFNFNQFNNCPFLLTNYFITLFSCLAWHQKVEPQLFSVCLSDGALSNTFVKVLVPVHVPGMPKESLGTALLLPKYFFA